MNERIKLLAEQAFVITTDGKIGHVNNYMVEKFAELIVEECMSCATWVGRMNTTAVEPVHTAEAINQRIRKHFGVEL